MSRRRTPTDPVDPDGPLEEPWKHGVWDPGLQAERTKLAWQRTALSSAACALVIARLVWSVHPVLGIVVGVSAIACGVMIGWSASRRSLRSRMAIHRSEGLPDARIHLWLALLIVVAGAGALIGAINLARH